MPRRYSVPLSTLLFLAAFYFLLPSPCLADADAIYRQNGKAVVLVVGFDEKEKQVSLGSGFIVREDGAVVTNYHVVSMAHSVKVKIGEKLHDVEGLVHADLENDLVILKVKARGLATVRLGTTGKLKVGEKVYVIGNPQGFENTISEGILSGLRRIDADRSLLQITAPISPGSSGGPVFNGNGEVIGIATFLIAEAQNMNFAMPIGLIKDKIANRRVLTLKNACSADYTKTADCWLRLGVAYGSSGMFQKSVEAFAEAVRIKPDLPEARVGLGIGYAGLNQYNEARAALEQAIKLKPDYQEALVNLGGVYDRLGMHNEAVRSLRKAIALHKDDPDAYFNLGIVYLNARDYPAAREALEGAIGIRPEHAETHGLLGVTYIKLDLPRKALDEFKQVIKYHPDDAIGHYALAETYVVLEDRASALEEYKILRRLDPAAADRLFKKIYH